MSYDPTKSRGTDSNPGLSAAVVIATYRRPGILRSTLRHWQCSRRSPDQFIIVDASPDAAEQRLVILDDFADLFATQGSEYIIGRHPSASVQRNLALDALQTDVVVFVDDESVPEPDFLEKIVEVYVLDKDELIGGVGGTERDEETVSAHLRAFVGDLGRQLARSFTTSSRHASPLNGRVPEPLRRLPLRGVRDLLGSRMSFRTPLAVAQRFDDRMMRFSFCEDLDISMRIGRTHLLVERTDAFVLHEEATLARIRADQEFFVRWVNPAYLTEKLFPGGPNRRPLDRLIAWSRLRNTLAHRLRRNHETRRATDERYVVAEAMISYLRKGPSATLGDRFTALQRRIFDEAPDDDLESLDAYRRWEASVPEVPVATEPHRSGSTRVVPGSVEG